MTTQEPMTDIVEPCPFCKSAKAFVSEADREIVALIYVACGDCGATGPGVDVDSLPTEKAVRAEAIRLWNTRAAYEVMARSDGELRAALNSIHEARLRRGEDHGYGWNITKLNRAMNAALPLLGKEVSAPLNLSGDEIEALRTLSGSSGHEG